jgi:hypothetical protein
LIAPNTSVNARSSSIGSDGARRAVGEDLEVEADENAGDGADDHEADAAKPGVHDARFISA